MQQLVEEVVIYCEWVYGHIQSALLQAEPQVHSNGIAQSCLCLCVKGAVEHRAVRWSAFGLDLLNQRDQTPSDLQLQDIGYTKSHIATNMPEPLSVSA